ncbi:type II secretion system F family protein [Nocardioides antri]|uniref:Type II secretion system F family protein n=1 Tax=Nocardioides antri TaxID=2607659 RepID=A0A5B1M7K0_9ACTN|nr:type II secretion system F family protein [Nocardioides antri]KAA1428496.1 type II secretion system F family protein [Nocardioides antri]
MVATAAVLAALAAFLVVPGRSAVPPPALRGLPGRPATAPAAEGALRRWRAAWACLAGVGAATLLGGAAAPLAGIGVAAAVWVVAGRIEPRAERLRREDVRRDLPHVVTLLGAALRSGAAPGPAIDLVRRALPGAAADVLGPIAARLALGADPVEVWSGLADDPAIGPLGRTMARAHRSGAPVVAAVERLSEELARRARAEVEDRARAVGVRAAVPLGVCLLPAFLLLGIVPLVAGLARSIAW